MELAVGPMAEARRRLAETLAFCDAGIWLGPPVGFLLAEELSPEGLPSALSRRWITGGLVSHWRGKTISAQDGNLALQAVLPRLPQDTYLVWTGLPLDPIEPGPLPGHGPLPARVRGVRIFPKSHGFPLTDWAIGSLCRWLIEHRLPLWIWHVELDWPSLYTLARQFSDLAIVVETQPQKILYHTRPLLALLRECPNVRVETSNFVGVRAIEHAVGQFGGERLIFGSFQPVSDPLVPMGMILDAEIPEPDKAAIAGGNLRRLIGQVEP